MRLYELRTLLARLRLTRPLTLRQEVSAAFLAVLVPGTVFMFYWYPSRQEALALDNARDKARETVELAGAAVGQALADTFDALTSRRPYKGAWPPALAWEFLQQNAGTRFDPACVRAFDGARDDAEEVRATLSDTPDDGRSRPGSSAAAAADGL